MLTNNPTPIFTRYLKQLEHIVQKIEVFANGNSDILNIRLNENMLPLINQIRTTANFSLRACCPLAGIDTVSFNNAERSFDGIKKQIANTVDFLNTIPEENFNTSNITHIKDKAGFSELNLPIEEYINHFALPNFFFHLAMVYAIARQCGVPVSKGDFDGYHEYPVGFSFEQK